MSDAHPMAETVTALLTQLICAALPIEDSARIAPRREALQLHEELRSQAVSEDASALHIDGLWTRAIIEANASGIARHALEASNRLPAISPLSLDDLLGPSLAFPELEERIRQSAATG